MRADENVDLTSGDIGEHLLDLLRGPEAAQHLDHDGKGGEAPFEALVMLKREYRGGREHRYLLAIAERLECSAHGYFRLSEPNVAAQEPVHGIRTFHVALDLLNNGELIFRFGELESVLELALPVAVGREAEAFARAALGVELQELLGHVAHASFHARLGALPRDATQAIERWGRAFAGASEFLDQVHARERHVQLRSIAILEQQKITLLFALRQLSRAEELADA